MPDPVPPLTIVEVTNMDRSRLRTDILALLILFLAVFIGLSLLSYDPADPPGSYRWPLNEQPTNLCGTAGSVVAHWLISGFGVGSVVILIGVLVFNGLLFLRKSISDRMFRLLGTFLLLISTTALVDKLTPVTWNRLQISNGGYLGAFITGQLSDHFSNTGTYLILIAVLIVGTLLTFDYLLIRLAGIFMKSSSQAFGKASSKTVGMLPNLKARFTRSSENSSSDANETNPEEEWQEPELRPVREAIPFNTPEQTTPPNQEDELLEGLELASAGQDETDYQLPSLDLLGDPEPFPYDTHAGRIREKGKVLETVLAQFGYNVKVVQIDTGPVITQYEIELEAGLRVGKIHSLADDLAIGLKAPAVRIVAPIPGKDTVGIEVPNDKRTMVRIKEVIRGAGPEVTKMRIPLFLGKDVKGNAIIYDLASMPHLLIAGRTGTGKSVCLNALIQSILMTRRPNEVKLLMIDPKMVELSQYRRIPHLMHPVVTDMKKAEALLAWAVDKMEERYDILARAGVRHVSSYNQLSEEEIYARLNPADEEERARIPKTMPFIVIFADEMADLMMTAPKEVEGHIIRLAQKSRAVGIHLIIATQKPTVDVITGLIKSNLPARIAFQVSSKSDSRVVLDESGAEKLLGHGDMLFLVPGTSQLVRAQGTFTSDEEIDAVVGFLEEYEPEYTRELLQLSTSSNGSKGEPGGAWKDRDELYEQAIDVIVREGRGSCSLLQRALGIGYGRAARLIDYMAEDGLVGDYNGSQAREVLCTPDEWEEMRLR